MILPLQKWPPFVQGIIQKKPCFVALAFLWDTDDAVVTVENEVSLFASDDD
jgi:hypothetical protein